MQYSIIFSCRPWADTGKYKLFWEDDKTFPVSRLCNRQESRLNKMARGVFADRDAAGQIAGMRTLNKDRTKAAGTGGGTRENAAEALNVLLAGNYGIWPSLASLAENHQASTGGDISVEDLSWVVLTSTPQGWHATERTRKAEQAFKVETQATGGVPNCAQIGAKWRTALHIQFQRIGPGIPSLLPESSRGLSQCLRFQIKKGT